MNVNVGSLDRGLRIIVGIALIAAAALGKVGWWGYIGIVPLATGLIKFCPLYTVLGLRTCPLEASKH